jgi:hypothetical protein
MDAKEDSRSKVTVLSRNFGGKELYTVLLVAKTYILTSKSLADKLTYWVSLYERVRGWALEVRHMVEENHKIYSTDEWTCPFHLALCPRCNAPSWQQPCPYCSFYPMGDTSFSLSDDEKKHAFITFSQYLRIIGAHAGSFTLFYLSSYKHVVAWKSSKNYREFVMKAGQDVIDLVEPTPEEIWTAVKFFGSISPFGAIVLPNS